MAGVVTIGTRIAAKPSELLDEQAAITLKPTRKYVGRGALKLEAALEHLNIDVRGKRALDIGASTGGFTSVAPTKFMRLMSATANWIGNSATIQAWLFSRRSMHDLFHVSTFRNS